MKHNKALEAIIGFSISPMTKQQKKIWDEQGILTCPHGGTDFKLCALSVRAYDALEPRPEDYGSGKVLYLSGDYESGDEAYGEWLECYCEEDGQVGIHAWRLPPDGETEYV